MQWYRSAVIRMLLDGVRVEIPTNQPVIVLREADGERTLPIFIGNPEATAIVHAMQGIETPRPMTHDLLKRVLDHQEVKLRRVEITELHDRTFHAVLEIEHLGTVSRLDARPSDAIALAVRFGVDEVPIFADESVLAEAGIVPQPDADGEAVVADEQIEEFRSFLDQVSPEDFA